MSDVALARHVELHIPYSQSLKDKRMVLRRVKDRLQKFNVAVAEVEHQDLWQRAGARHRGHLDDRRARRAGSWQRPPTKSTGSSPDW